MKEIYIYGDIVPFKWYNDGSEYDLSDLNTSLSGLTMEAGEELIVNIHTFGGCTLTAFGIFNKLRRFAADNKIKLTTRIDGYCASAGVSIFLAGDRRIGNSYAEPFVHNAWTFMMGVDKKEAQKIAEDLTKTDNNIATLYADRTNLSVEQALQLMDADSWLSAEQCMEMGFYTELENVYVADREVFNSLRKERKSNFNNNIDMSKNKKNADTLWAEIKNSVNKFFGTEGSKNKIVYTAANEALDFYELADDATPVVGDKATFDGKPAGESNDGTYVMASGETYIFTGEDLTEIIPAADGGGGADNALETENAELKNQITAKDAIIANLTKENKAKDKRIKDAETILNKIQNGFTDDEDIDDEDIDEPAGRNPKNNKSAEVETRNLWASIK